MNCGCVNEPNRVSNMTDDGLGFSPPVPVKVVEHIGPSGREMSDTVYQSADTKIPNVVFGEPTVLIDTTTLTFSKDGDNDWYVSDTITFPSDNFHIYTLYSVTWDNVEYKCFSVQAFRTLATRINYYSYLLIGNPEVFGFGKVYDDTDAPFVIAYLANTSSTRVYTSSNIGQHTLKVVSIPYTFEEVDPRYLLSINDSGRTPLPVRGEGMDSYIFNLATTAKGLAASAFNIGTKADGRWSAAFGECCEANGRGSFAEGSYTISGSSSAYATHAEGSKTNAIAHYSHAEGQATTASGTVSHAEGSDTIASGSRSHTEGDYTIANHRAQHVFGQWNVADPSAAAVTARGNYVEIVGNGTADDARSNARTLDWSGNEVLSGSLTLGKGTADEVTITAAQLKALLATLTE